MVMSMLSNVACNFESGHGDMLIAAMSMLHGFGTRPHRPHIYSHKAF
jgi:hypothetical protein